MFPETEVQRGDDLHSQPVPIADHPLELLCEPLGHLSPRTSASPLASPPLVLRLVIRVIMSFFRQWLKPDIVPVAQLDRAAVS